MGLGSKKVGGNKVKRWSKDGRKSGREVRDRQTHRKCGRVGAMTGQPERNLKCIVKHEEYMINVLKKVICHIIMA